MTTGLNFWDIPVWSFVLTMFFLFFSMMVANTLRNIIRPLRKLMIPSSVLGGLILLLADFICREISGKALVSASTLEMLTYHGLGLGFVAMALRNLDKKKDQRSRTVGCRFADHLDLLLSSGKLLGIRIAPADGVRSRARTGI